MAFEFLEYEEKVGRLWHRLIGEPASWPAFPEAAVELAPLKASLAVLFRGAGGEHGVLMSGGGGGPGNSAVDPRCPEEMKPPGGQDPPESADPPC